MLAIEKTRNASNGPINASTPTATQMELTASQVKMGTKYENCGSSKVGWPGASGMTSEASLRRPGQ